VGFGFAVAPTTSDRVNTLRQRLIVRACWRMNRSLFEFDSSFIRPEISEDLKRLQALRKGSPRTLIGVFGHADPSGEDDYNKELAGRRATALFALLTRDPAAWEKLFSSPSGGDNWGLRSTQRILTRLTRKSPAPNPSDPNVYYTGTVDGTFGPLTDRAIRDFQTDNGLAVDGIAGPNTRAVLYPLYMDAISISEGSPFKLEAKDFVGEGADPGGKGAMQGCGEFNPVRILSKADQQKLAQSKEQRARDPRNAQNRRVTLFLFEKATLPPLAEWPCPLVSEGSSGCRAQFFGDGEQRRAAAEEERAYPKTRDTMACKFYDRLARFSPCEGGVRFQVLEGRILLRSGGPAIEMPFVVRVNGEVIDGGFTDAQGRYRVLGVAGKTEVALVDRFHMAESADQPGQEVVAVQTRPAPEPDFGGGGTDGTDSGTAVV
jgi:peptidoglycan hydrolase-like protein with peptidoglycan-binding domain